MASKRTVLITGCSQGGLGDSLARAFHSQGLRVFATARNPSKIAHFKALGIETLELDVLSDESIRSCVAEVVRLTDGSLDILLNNSGGSYLMPLMDVSIEEARKLFDLNVWAMLSVSRSFLPLFMKSHYGGMIVNQTSIASVMYVPMQGIYGASKAAATILTATLRLELAPFGIKVIELKTGSVKSNIFSNMGESHENQLPAGSIYAPARTELETIMSGEPFQTSLADPDVWATDVVRNLTKKSPVSTLWRGRYATFAWVASTFFPQALFERALKQVGGMDVVAKRLQEMKKTA